MKLKVKSLKLKATKSLRSRRLRQSHAKQGFTLIELIMVIVIIGILSAVAIPMYVDLQTQAKEASELGTIGGVRAGIGIWHASSLVNAGATEWPPLLDGETGSVIASSSNPFFVSVLDTPITSDWSKESGETTEYRGPTNQKYVYTPGTGRFESSA